MSKWKNNITKATDQWGRLLSFLIRYSMWVPPSVYQREYMR